MENMTLPELSTTTVGSLQLMELLATFEETLQITHAMWIAAEERNYNFIEPAASDNNITLARGHNTVLLGEGNKHLVGGSGNEAIIVTGGNHTVNAGEGNNIIVVNFEKGQESHLTIENGGGLNTIFLQNFDNYIDKSTYNIDIKKADNGKDAVMISNDGKSSITIKGYYDNKQNSFPLRLDINGGQYLNLEKREQFVEAIAFFYTNLKNESSLTLTDFIKAGYMSRLLWYGNTKGKLLRTKEVCEKDKKLLQEVQNQLSINQNEHVQYGKTLNQYKSESKNKATAQDSLSKAQNKLDKVQTAVNNHEVAMNNLNEAINNLTALNEQTIHAGVYTPWRLLEKERILNDRLKELEGNDVLTNSDELFEYIKELDKIIKEKKK